MLSSTTTLIDVSVCSAHLLCYSGVECPLKGDGGLGSWSEGWQAVVEVVTEQQHEYRVGGTEVTRLHGRGGRGAGAHTSSKS